MSVMPKHYRKPHVIDVTPCRQLWKRSIFADNCEVKETWYIHVFDDKQLFVVLRGRYFMLSLNRDYSWNEMIEYGVNEAKVERRFLENVPLHV